MARSPWQNRDARRKWVLAQTETGMQNSADKIFMLNLLQRIKQTKPGSSHLRWERIFALAFVMLCFVPGAAAASFTASLDRETVVQGESATLSLAFEGGNPKTAPALPNIPNLRITGQGTSSQFTVVNGVASTSQVQHYLLTPTKPGEYPIPALTVEIDGQTLQSQPLKLTVTKSDTQTAFLKLVLPKNEVYVGEVIQVEMQLYLQDGVQGIREFQMTPPAAEGFTVGKTSEGQHRQARVGNIGYQIVPLNMTFVAAKAGTLTLGPVECNATLIIGPVDFFGRAARVQAVSLSSDSLSIKSLPLPRENVPPSFSGAVGNFSMEVNVGPTNISVGDPLTVKVQIKGEGGIEAVTLPTQADWNLFKVYPPTSEFQPGDQHGLTGTKSFQLTAVPESMDVKELPPFLFTFFDPAQKTYRTLSHPAVPLTVRPSAASLPPPMLAGVSSTESNPPPAQDIAHIKPRLGIIAQVPALLFKQPWFLALQAIPILAWLSLLLMRKQKEALQNNPRLRRQRQVEQTVRDGLKQSRQSAQANQTEEFFAGVFHLLQERIGERLDLPASAITEAIVEERLRPAHVPEDTLNLLRELFQLCNQARYAPQSTTRELMSLIPKVETALDSLRNIKT
jgi:hypothetical protein